MFLGLTRTGSALTGVVCGLSLVITNLYIADIAPISLRRSMGMLNSMFMVFGTVLSQAVSLSLAKPLIWRWSLGLTSFLAVAQVIASYFVVQISHQEEQEEEERAEEEGLPLVVTCGSGTLGRRYLKTDGQQSQRRDAGCERGHRFAGSKGPIRT